MPIRLLLAVLCLLLIGAVPAAGQDDKAGPAGGRGALVLEGGGRPAAGFEDRVLALAGGAGDVCLITTALGDLQGGSGSAYNRFAGVPGARTHVLDIDAANSGDPAVLATLRGCEAFYFTGGDPQRLSLVLVPGGQESPALAVIRQRFAAGAVVSGSSAGAMIVGDLTLCECGAVSSVNALLYGELFEAAGFGLVDGVLVDAHFFARGLIGRHAWQLARRDIPVGVGIDEGTAVVVPGDGGPWQVIGAGGVGLVARDPAGPGLGTFTVSLLAPGDRFDPDTGAVVVAPHRRPVPSAAGAAGPLRAADVFAPGRVPDLMVELARGPARRAVGFAAAGAIKLSLAETGRTRAFAGADGSWTVLDLAMHIDVEPGR
jgi:cyanophycinase